MPLRDRALSMLEDLQKAHDWIGKAQSVKDNTLKVAKASRTDRSDYKNLFKVAGIYDEDAERLKRTLDRRSRDIQAICKTSYGPVKNNTKASWKRWRDAATREGESGPTANSARDAYFRSIKRYDYALRERISYMDMVIRKSKEQEGLYNQLAIGVSRAQSALGTLAKIPRHWDVDHQTPSLAGYLNLQTILGSVRSVKHAYGLLGQHAKRHRAAVLAAKRENDKWLRHAKAADAVAFARSVRAVGNAAKEALGF